MESIQNGEKQNGEITKRRLLQNGENKTANVTKQRIYKTANTTKQRILQNGEFTKQRILQNGEKLGFFSHLYIIRKKLVQMSATENPRKAYLKIRQKIP